jgi:hypothetical protein
LTNFITADAFALLEQWGIETAIESFYLQATYCSVDPNVCCTGPQAVTYSLGVSTNAIAGVESNGGIVDYLVLDEPVYKWTETYYNIYTGIPDDRICLHPDIATLATDVASYITQSLAAHPNARIGQVDLYPEVGVDQIKEYILALEDEGVSLEFYHLDINGTRLDQYVGWGYPVDLATDLVEISGFLKKHGVRLGVTYTDPRGPKVADLSYGDSKYYTNAMELIGQVRDAIGKPDDAIFQSWLASTDATGWKVVPTNLEEDDEFSHTKLILDGIRDGRMEKTEVSSFGR